MKLSFNIRFKARINARGSVDIMARFRLRQTWSMSAFPIVKDTLTKRYSVNIHLVG